MPAGAWQEHAAAIIAKPADALNVMDFEAAARRTLPPAHFGYLATGVDDDSTLHANRAAYSRVQLRPRRAIDVTTVDMSVSLFGSKWAAPVIIAPCGSQRAFHPEGEVAVARAAGSKKSLQILSTVSTCSVEDVSKAHGNPVWFQLYSTQRWEVTEKLVKRAAAAGCPVLVMTVDLPVGRNTETLERFKRLDTRKCETCHSETTLLTRKPMFDGIDSKGLTVNNPAISWEFVRRVKALTGMKLVLKGIETAEDTRLALDNGVDGVIVSNHGGRAEESGRATLECLPEVVEAAAGKVPVLVDGGIRRGTDVFKALALGAKAVCIGRPYLWALSAFGRPGVERVLEIFQYELDLAMRQCGTRSLAEIGRPFVNTAKL